MSKFVDWMDKYLPPDRFFGILIIIVVIGTAVYVWRNLG